MKIKPCLAEFLGTFALCFLGIGAVANDAGLVAIAFAHGLAIACMGTALAGVSGSHFNPAVSISLASVGRLKWADCGAYIVSQVLGAVAAVASLSVIFGEKLKAVSMGIPAPAGIEMGAAILAEFILTFFLVGVVFGTAVDAKAPKMGAWFIGLTVAMDILVGGPITGGAMNPARYLGPAIMKGDFANIAIYMVGPIAGAVVAAFLWTAFLKDSEAA